MVNEKEWIHEGPKRIDEAGAAFGTIAEREQRPHMKIISGSKSP